MLLTIPGDQIKRDWLLRGKRSLTNIGNRSYKQLELRLSHPLILPHSTPSTPTPRPQNPDLGRSLCSLNGREDTLGALFGQFAGNTPSRVHGEVFCPRDLAMKVPCSKLGAAADYWVLWAAMHYRSPAL